MLKIKCTKGRVAVACNGNIAEIAAELGAVISKIYAEKNKKDPMSAEAFKRIVQIVASDDSPVWDLSEEGADDGAV